MEVMRDAVECGTRSAERGMNSEFGVRKAEPLTKTRLVDRSAHIAGTEVPAPHSDRPRPAFSRESVKMFTPYSSGVAHSSGVTHSSRVAYTSGVAPELQFRR